MDEESTEITPVSLEGGSEATVDPAYVEPESSVTLLNGEVVVTKAFQESKSGRAHHILDIEWTFSTFFFVYEKKGNIATFTATEGHVLRLIKQNRNILYDPLTECECALKVEYEENNKIIIHKVDDTTEEIYLKLLVINVNNKCSTDLIEYVKDTWEDTETFTVKKPYLISLIKEDEELLWQAKSGLYPNKVLLKVDKNKKNVLEIIYPKDNDGDIVVEGKIIADTDDFYDEYTYIFSDTVKCAKVEYNKKPVWTCEKVEEPKFVKMRKKGNKVGFRESPASFCVITKGSVNPNDDTKYYFTQPSSDEKHYIFKKHVKCTEVKVNGEVIWKHNVREYGGSYPKAVSYYGEDEVVITFSDFLLFLEQSDGLWDPQFFDELSPADPEPQHEESAPESTPVSTPVLTHIQSDITLFTSDTKDSTKKRELDSSQYFVTQDPYRKNAFNYQLIKDSNCTLIRHIDKDVWHYDLTKNDGYYPESLHYNKESSRILLKLPSTYLLYERDGNNWTNADIPLKVFGRDPSDPNYAKELDTSKYDVTLHRSDNDVIYYYFNGLTKCTLVSCNDSSLWSYDPGKHPNQYPLSLEFNKRTPKVLLNFEPFVWSFEKDSEGNWITHETTKNVSGQFSDSTTVSVEDESTSDEQDSIVSTPPADKSGLAAQQKVKLFKGNPSDPANPLELDANDYTIHKEGNVCTYHIKVISVKLMFDDVLFWQHDPNQRGGIHPKSVVHDANSNVIVLRFEGLDMTFENTVEGWTFTESGPLAVKFHVVDPGNHNNTVELASNQLEVTANGDITTFTIANGVNCVKLMYGYVLLWLHDSTQHGGKYPKSLDYTKTTDTLVLKFDGVDLTFAKNDQGQWEYTVNDKSAGGASNNPESGDTTPADQNGSSSTTPPDSSSESDPSSNNNNNNIIKVSATRDNYRTKDNNNNYCPNLNNNNSIRTFNFNNNNNNNNNNNIKYNINNNASRVGKNKNNSNSSSTSPDSTSLSGTSQDLTSTTSTDVKTTQLEAIDLDVKNTKSTDTFICLKKDGFAKYIAKSGYGFSSVKGKTGSSCGGSSVPIWEAEQNTDLATAVVRDGTGTCKNMENVTIFFGKSHRHFTKSNKTFVQDSDIRLYGNDESNDLTQLAPTEYSLDHTDHIFKFTFNDDTQCNEVKFVHRSLEGDDSAKVVVSEVSLWKHDQSKHGGKYPLVLRYYWPDKILITFPNFFIIYNKNTENKWDEGHLFDFKLYSKDSDNKLKAFDLKSYDLIFMDEEYVFTFKKDVKLAEVKHKGDELWKHDPSKHGDKYPQVLRYVPDKMAISFDDSFIVFTRDSEGKLGNVHLFDFKLYGKGSDNNLKELGFTAYDIIFKEEEYVFTFKKDVKLAEVKHKGDELWKHDSSKHGDEYPLYMRYKSDGSRIVIPLSDFFAVYEMLGEGNVKKTELFINLYQQDPTDASKTLELQGADYDLKEQDDKFTFLLDKNIDCSMVKVEGKELWKHDPSNPEDSHPTSVSYWKDTKYVLLEYPKYFVTYQKGEDKVFDCGKLFDIKLYFDDPNNPSQLVAFNYSKYEIIEGFDEYEFKIKNNSKCLSIKLSGIEIWKHDSSVNGDNYPELIFYKRDRAKLLIIFQGYYVLYEKNVSGGYSSKVSITLDILSHNPTDHYDYSDHKYFSLYAIKDGFLYGLIKLGDKTIYRPVYLFECATKAVIYKNFDSEIRYVDVYLANGSIKRFERLPDSDEWHQKISPLFLDIRKKEQACYYNYSSNNNVSTYIAKDNFGFKKIRFGMRKVWQSSDNNEYAFKVDVNEWEKTCEILVHMYNGEKKVFNMTKGLFTDISLPKFSLATKASVPETGTPVIPRLPNDKLPTEYEITSPNKPYLVYAPERAPDPPANQVFDLDITQRQNTIYYTYSRDETKKLDSFKCNPGYLVRKVKKSDHVLWEPRNNRHGIQVDVYHINSATTPLVRSGSNASPANESQDASGSRKSSSQSSDENQTNSSNGSKTENVMKLGIVVYFDGDGKCMRLKTDPGGPEDTEIPDALKPKETQPASAVPPTQSIDQAQTNPVSSANGQSAQTNPVSSGNGQSAQTTLVSSGTSEQAQVTPVSQGASEPPKSAPVSPGNGQQPKAHTASSGNGQPAKSPDTSTATSVTTPAASSQSVTPTAKTSHTLSSSAVVIDHANSTSTSGSSGPLAAQSHTPRTAPNQSQQITATSAAALTPAGQANPNGTALKPLSEHVPTVDNGVTENLAQPKPKAQVSTPAGKTSQAQPSQPSATAGQTRQRQSQSSATATKPLATAQTSQSQSSAGRGLSSGKCSSTVPARVGRGQ
ncbi:hypothetical protein MACK_002312 [Theileria orientalis]|uniref:Uncharacterized protein n=1 Tax=Theileria orientalis TaxID=68886 RepID=A0A976QT18_THEOR|nr:hypothetical protein MACK_002312 [Theileria orientalis]